MQAYPLIKRWGNLDQNLNQVTDSRGISYIPLDQNTNQFTDSRGLNYIPIDENITPVTDSHGWRYIPYSQLAYFHIVDDRRPDLEEPDYSSSEISSPSIWEGYPFEREVSTTRRTVERDLFAPRHYFEFPASSSTDLDGSRGSFVIPRPGVNPTRSSRRIVTVSPSRRSISRRAPVSQRPRERPRERPKERLRERVIQGKRQGYWSAPQSRDITPPARGWSSRSRDITPPSRGWSSRSRDITPSSRGWSSRSRDISPPSRGWSSRSRDITPPSRGWSSRSRDSTPPFRDQKGFWSVLPETSQIDAPQPSFLYKGIGIYPPRDSGDGLLAKKRQLIHEAISTAEPGTIFNANVRRVSANPIFLPGRVSRPGTPEIPDKIYQRIVTPPNSYRSPTPPPRPSPPPPPLPERTYYNTELEPLRSAFSAFTPLEGQIASRRRSSILSQWQDTLNRQKGQAIQQAAYIQRLHNIEENPDY